MARALAYAQLSESEASLYEPLQRLDAARQDVSRINVEIAQYRAEKKIAEQLLNQSRMARVSLQESVSVANTVYQRLIREINHTLVLSEILNEIDEHVVTVNNVSFDIVVLTESPTRIPLLVNYSFPLLGTTYLEEIIIDFEYLKSSLMQEAVQLTDMVFIEAGSRRRKRQTEDTGQQNISKTAEYFGEQCTDIKNVQQYITELVTSLETISNVSNSSKDAVIANVMSLGDLSAASVTVNTSNAINLTYLESEFGVTVNMTEMMMSEEPSGITNLLNNLLTLTMEFANSVGENSFVQWQTKMEDLHNQTGSAGGYRCFGFSDCLLNVGRVTEGLLLLTPQPKAAQLLSELEEAENNFIGLALEANLSISEAIGRADKISKLLEEFMQLNYWCASVPNITVQPANRTATAENSTVVLTCTAESLAPINYKWKRGGNRDIAGSNSNTLTLSDIKFSDADNYTCVVSNHIGSVSSSNASVEVQELPALFLQPVHQDIYLRDQNGAQFKCNATGTPYPGFRWYYKAHNATEFVVVNGEDENEYTLPNTLPEHEGVYYCEAYNEQGAVQSDKVNLTVLGTSIAQLAQYLTFSATVAANDSDDDVATNLTMYSGSGDVDISPVNTPIEDIKFVLENLVNLSQTTIENFSIVKMDNTFTSVSFGLYSYNISYSGIDGNDLLLVGPEARNEWGDVINTLKDALSTEEVIFSNGENVFQLVSSSLESGDILFVCPKGLAIYEANQFLCVSCAAGSYQVNAEMTQTSDNGSQTVVMPECVTCPTGSYQYVQGQLECIECPGNHSTRGSGTRLPEGCLPLCPPGEYSIDGFVPCTKCPPGSYQNSYGQAECVQCPDGYSTTRVGSLKQEECKQLCSPGEYSSNGFEQCMKCACGTYSELGAVECSVCPTTGAPPKQCDDSCTAPTPTTNSSSKKNEAPVVAIAAGVGGGGGVAVIVIVVIILILTVVMLRKKYRKNRHHYDVHNPTNQFDITVVHNQERKVEEETVDGVIYNLAYVPEDAAMHDSALYSVIPEGAGFSNPIYTEYHQPSNQFGVHGQEGSIDGAVSDPAYVPEDGPTNGSTNVVAGGELVNPIYMKYHENN